MCKTSNEREGKIQYRISLVEILLWRFFPFNVAIHWNATKKNLYNVGVAFQTEKWNFLLSLLAYAESSRGTGFVRSHLSFSSVRFPLLALSVWVTPLPGYKKKLNLFLINDLLCSSSMSVLNCVTVNIKYCFFPGGFSVIAIKFFGYHIQAGIHTELEKLEWTEIFERSTSVSKRCHINVSLTS